MNTASIFSTCSLDAFDIRARWLTQESTPRDGGSVSALTYPTFCMRALLSYPTLVVERGNQDQLSMNSKNEHKRVLYRLRASSPGSMGDFTPPARDCFFAPYKIKWIGIGVHRRRRSTALAEVTDEDKVLVDYSFTSGGSASRVADSSAEHGRLKAVASTNCLAVSEECS